ncbi:hypothetical protein H7J86_24185 [Mycobacterium hackensackense]|uniref:hypothetical protein n=1 Tax=Mycobacterium hackensackense TaxID=228909 RepID=UPI0022659261|nr:hypothetical protein [Mycobacterium hackensackense]MCV7255266.1 hypothetical protein [Mycobacterium hackensackense]
MHYDAFRADRAAAGQFRGGASAIEPVREHIATLRGLGLGFYQLSKLSGVPDRTIQGIVFQKRTRVFASTAVKLLAVPVPTSPHLVAAGHAFVDATGTVRRLRALTALGHSNQSVADRTGLNHQQISHIALGKQRVVFARVALVIDVAFRAMQLEVPPDGYAKRRAKARAERRGWSPALAWDEDTLDDPAATPDTGSTRRATFLERIAELHESGITDPTAIADHLGLKTKSVHRQLLRMKEAS